MYVECEMSKYSVTYVDILSDQGTRLLQFHMYIVYGTNKVDCGQVRAGNRKDQNQSFVLAGGPDWLLTLS